MKVCVIGSGVFGLAMAERIKRSGRDVTVWTEVKNPSEISVGSNIEVTNDFSVALLNAKVVFVLTAAKYTPQIFESIKPYVTNEMILVLGSKGILENGSLIIDALLKTLPNVNYSVIGGPTFASDVKKDYPIGFTLAVKEEKSFALIKSLFPNTKMELSLDPIGIELLGVLKNAYAIGSGIIFGLGTNDSTRCLFINLVIKEIKSILKSLGANEESVYTLAGFGDLMLTCYSTESRNFSFGSVVFKNDKETSTKFLQNNTVEGYANLLGLQKLCKEKSIEAPILSCIYEIVLNNLDSTLLLRLLTQ